MVGSLLILRLRGPALARIAVVAVVLGWMLLDLQWDSGLRWRHAATESLYAEFEWPERELHSADQDVIETAHALKRDLRDLPENSRILVHAGSSFATLRLIYHLLPMNVAVLVLAADLTPPVPLPDGSIIVVYDAPDWSYDPQRQQLQGGGLSFSGEIVIRSDRLLVLRVRSLP